MCIRYIVEDNIDIAEMQKILYKIRSNKEHLNIRQYNIKTGDIIPNDYAPVIVPCKGNRINAVAMKWGFSHPLKRSMVINVRFEGIRTRRLFKEAVECRRCVIPTNGFYEWRKLSGGRKEKYKMTAAYNSMLYLAGIYTIRKDKKTGEDIYEFAIVTKQSEGVFSMVNSRVPMIIPKSELMNWLSCHSRDLDDFYYARAPELTIRSYDYMPESYIKI